MFYVWQALLIGFAIFAAYRDGFARLFRRRQPMDAALIVTRNDARMTALYSIGGIVIGILLAINYGAGEPGALLWSLLDIALVVYLFVFNVWFRNRVYAIGDRMREERR